MSKTSRSTLGPTYLLTQGVPGAVSQGEKGQDVKLTFYRHLVPRLIML